MKLEKTFKHIVTDEDFFACTFLFVFSFFVFPVALYLSIINYNDNCNILCNIIKVTIYNILPIIILGIIFNYFLLRINCIQRFLLLLIEGDKEKIKSYFVYGGFFSYISILIIIFYYFISCFIEKKLNYCKNKKD